MTARYEVCHFEAFVRACADLTFDNQQLLKGDDFLQLNAQERCALLDVFYAGDRIGFVLVHASNDLDDQIKSVLAWVASVGIQLALLTIMPRLPDATHAFVVIFKPLKNFAQQRVYAVGKVFWVQGHHDTISSHTNLESQPELYNVDSIHSLCEMLSLYAQERADKIGKKVYVKTIVECGFIDQQKLGLLLEILQALVSNALEHGIELPAERLINNKSEYGNITITWADQDDAEILITVQDDGASIALDDLKKSLVHEQILSTDMVEFLSADELADYFFTHSFNDWHIHESHGQLSLPQVREKLKNLGGRVRMHITPFGTMVRIHISRVLQNNAKPITLLDSFWNMCRRWFGR